MKEDYLWDKTGSDSEIEKLESTLKTYRLKDTSPPIIPVVEFETEIATPAKSNWLMRPAFAAFGCLVIAAVSLILLNNLREPEQAIAAAEDTNPIESKIESKNPAPVKIVSSKEEILHTQEKPLKITKASFSTQLKKRRQLARKQQLRAQKISYKKVMKSRAKPKLTKSKKNVVRLTKEEKEAYDQLLKALAITGSQMKIVREGIKGERVNSAEKDGR